MKDSLFETLFYPCTSTMIWLNRVCVTHQPQPQLTHSMVLAVAVLHGATSSWRVRASSVLPCWSGPRLRSVFPAPTPPPLFTRYHNHRIYFLEFFGHLLPLFRPFASCPFHLFLLRLLPVYHLVLLETPPRLLSLPLGFQHCPYLLPYYPTALHITWCRCLVFDPSNEPPYSWSPRLPPPKSGRQWSTSKTTVNQLRRD